MARQARLDAPGTLHHVMIRGIEKGKIVDDRQDRQTMLDSMGHAALENDVKIYAFAFMTNHAHILLKSGKVGISQYMRRFLTRYAMAYNRRHQRHGYLFQNRYKSIICEEDAYFQELVRYIHLNPLRVHLVRSLNALDQYPWCGHSGMMGNRKYEWQNTAYVLKWFGKNTEESRKAYREYLEQGISMGTRPDLVGGSLIRALGRWSEVASQRLKKGDNKTRDDRILGSEAFVERMLKGAEDRIKRQLPLKEKEEKVEEWIETACEKEKISIHELRSGSRRGRLPAIRRRIAGELIAKYGLSLAELGRRLGVTTSAVSKMMARHE